MRRPNSCEAAGYVDVTGGNASFLTEFWVGTTFKGWTVSYAGQGNNYLDGVSCASATSCKAVGTYQVQSGGVYQTFIESLSGNTMSQADSSPNNGANANELLGVSCISATSCKTVGRYIDPSSHYQTLIEAYG